MEGGSVSEHDGDWWHSIGPEPANGGKRDKKKADFEILASRIVFDRNSRVGFHKLMVTAGLKSNWREPVLHEKS